MSNDQLNTERNRFLILNVVRITGALMILFALAIISRGFLGLPQIAGYVFLVVGIVEFIVMPVVLAKAWRSKPDL